MLSSPTFTCFQLLNQAILSSNQSIFLLDPKVPNVIGSSGDSIGLVTYPWLFKKIIIGENLCGNIGYMLGNPIQPYGTEEIH